MKARHTFSLAFLASLLLTGGLAADDEEISAQLNSAKKRATEQSCTLRYRFTAGEVVRWKVVHLGTTETTIQGNVQTAKARTTSTKSWKITEVDDEGNATFVHSVPEINMWQKLSGRPEVRYDSSKDEAPPRQYREVAKTVGVPIATVTISPTGKVVKRGDSKKSTSFGLGDIAIPMPEKPVKPGDKWSTTDEIRVREADGRVKRIKTRLIYELEKVQTGVATISVDTEVLTPVNDPKVKSQLVQQLTTGNIKFDVDAGRPISRQIDWDETVVGFNGADSMMKYLARFTEELLPGDATASTDAGPELTGPKIR